MKRGIIVLLVGLISILSIAQNSNDTIVLKKIDKLQETINQVAQQQVKTKSDSLSISAKHFEKLTQTLDKKDSVWGLILPSVIAILVVIISTLGASWQGRRQIRAQTANAEAQIRSQEAQAQDNLRVAREQIQETSRMTLAQVRANNISQARINWIQDLRSELSRYIGEVAIINFYLQEVIELNKNRKKEEAKELYNAQIDRIKEARQYAFKIKLFLNKGESDHSKLESLIDNYFKTALDDYSTVKSNFNTISNDILDISRKILKDAWEQAKSEGTY